MSSELATVEIETKIKEYLYSYLTEGQLKQLQDYLKDDLHYNPSKKHIFINNEKQYYLKIVPEISLKGKAIDFTLNQNH